jgi:hypothetical protein
MSHVSKKLGGCGVAAITEASKNKYTKLSLRSAMPHNGTKLCEVAEFGNMQHQVCFAVDC